jgi:hypothetical protein
MAARFQPTFVLAAGAVLVASLSAQHGAAAVKKLALLVGIQDYQHAPSDEFGPLGGPRNDMELVARTLVEHLGFARENVKALVDAQATHEAIVRAWDEWLIQRADADTEVIFWFCGHGSRVRDRSDSEGAEQDAMDASFLAWDSRSQERDGSYDIVDDEFHSLLAALARKTARVLVVTDACYGGGGFRGGTIGAARGVREGSQPFARATIAPFWPAHVPYLDDDADRPLDLGQRYVHLSACANRQRAFEIAVDTPGGKVVYGAFSYYLLQAIREAGPGDTCRRIADRARLLVATHVPVQSVWTEGALDREFLGARFVPRPPGFAAGQEAEGRIAIDAGALHGLAQGSELHVFAADDTKLGTAEVNQLGAGGAIAAWRQAPAQLPPPGTPLRVVEVSRPAHLPALPVAIDSDALREALADNPWVDARAGEPDLRIRGETRADAALETAEGVRLWARHSIEEALAAEGRWQALWRLPLTPGSLPISARFVAPDANELARDWAVPMTAAAVAPVGDSGREFEGAFQTYSERSGELTILEIANEHDADVFVAVLSITEARQIAVIWPEDGRQDNVLPVDGERRVPVWVYAERDWPLQRPMRDRYIVIATRRHVSFESFTNTGRLRGGPEPDADLLPGALRIAFTGTRTRGGNQPLSGFARHFGVISVDLLVSRRP